MDTQHQFYIFTICIAIGFIGGMLYEIIAFFRWLFKAKTRKWLCVSLDIFFWVLFAGVFVLGAYIFRFPSFRIYMWIGCFCGGILYLKSVRRILAFFEKVCYNTAIKTREKHKNKEKNLPKVEK